MVERDGENVHEVWSEDELDVALAALNAELDTDERALGRTRAALMVAAGDITDQEKTMSTTEQEQQTAQPSTTDTVARRHWGRWAVAAAAVVALVAGALVVQTISFGGNPPAAAALNSAADKIGASDQPVGPGQYRYIATHAWWMGSTVAKEKSFSYLAENLLETWVPADQSQEWLWRRDVTGARKWIQGTEADAGAAGVLDRPGWPEGEWKARCGDWFAAEQRREPCTAPTGWQNPTSGFLASLPPDPQRLYDRLRADAPVNSRGDTELLVYAADALRSGLVPADTRAALYRALAKLPDLEITDQLANLDGRVGIAYGMSDGDSRHEIIIDPATGEFIGERETVIKDLDGMRAGTVMSYTSVSTAVVNEMGAKPAG